MEIASKFYFIHVSDPSGMEEETGTLHLRIYETLFDQVSPEPDRVHRSIKSLDSGGKTW